MNDNRKLLGDRVGSSGWFSNSSLIEVDEPGNRQDQPYWYAPISEGSDFGGGSDLLGDLPVCLNVRWGRGRIGDDQSRVSDLGWSVLIVERERSFLRVSNGLGEISQEPFQIRRIIVKILRASICSNPLVKE